MVVNRTASIGDLKQLVAETESGPRSLCRGGPAAGMGIFGHEATSLESSVQCRAWLGTSRRKGQMVLLCVVGLAKQLEST